MKLSWKEGSQIAGILLLPFLGLTAYLVAFGRSGGSPIGDSVALCVSVALGLAVLMTAPIGGWQKALAGLVYFLIMAGALLLYGFAFVCGAYGRCL